LLYTERDFIMQNGKSQVTEGLNIGPVVLLHYRLSVTLSG